MKIVNQNDKYDLNFLLSRDKKECTLIGISVKENIFGTGKNLPNASAKAELFNVIIPQEIMYIDDDNKESFSVCTKIDFVVFFNQKVIKEIVIPETVREIGNACFMNCSNLQVIEIPEAIKKIGTNLFTNCKRLHKVVLPESIKIIPQGTFQGCTFLKEIELPSEIIEIGENAFLNSGLDHIFIPESVEKIGNHAFMDCGSLESVSTFEDKFPDECFRNIRLKKIIRERKNVEEKNDTEVVEKKEEKETENERLTFDKLKNENAEKSNKKSKKSLADSPVKKFFLKTLMDNISEKINKKIN